MQGLTELLGGIVFISGTVGIVYIIAHYTYLIRKMMLEKGLEPNPFFTKNRFIEWACLLFFVGVGSMISAAFTTLELKEDTADLLIGGTILIVGSVGPLVAYLIRKRLDE